MDRPPIVFVPGNGRDGDDFDDAVEALRNHGHTDRKMVQVDFPERTPSHGAMASYLDGRVDEVLDDADAEHVDVVAHSLGVTGVRWWMLARGRHGDVRRFAAIAGANHGLTGATYASKMGLAWGPWSVSTFLRSDYERLEGHPLELLNRDETPGDVRYYTIRGTRDGLYALDPKTPCLDGAEENVALDENHCGLIESEETFRLLAGWLA